ncbi:MAG: inositol-3-phosphate synthase [Planctomycetota bacterium]|nr:inositol-3-phosphate synthase [Planctomycetota bacterium]
MKSPTKAKNQPTGKLGVWIFGAMGGLATTMVVGARSIARGKSGAQGLLTETEEFSGLSLQGLDGLVFGGHEVRKGTIQDAADEIHKQTGTIPYELIRSLSADLRKITNNLRPGCLINAGKTITKLSGTRVRKGATLRKEANRLVRDIKDFMVRNKLKRCVCVNLTSTEPKLRLTKAHDTARGIEKILDDNRTTAVRPSAIYAYAAAQLGLPFIHFTPSNAALVPGIREIFELNEAPNMGCDGKTGETLVKSSLAPMFKYRNLKVLTWQGYNILGDRDGVVLADQENRSSKIESKDALLSKILGYPLHTHVGIDYVPSLNDLKTAWDFIHFQGFLDYKMTMQFTWQGCDAILAAPIVLDMVRFADLAKRRGEVGPMSHLSCYFKSPLDIDQHDLHLQWHLMTDYLRKSSS